jgi:hypothetical protein
MDNTGNKIKLPDRFRDCMICGKPLVYFDGAVRKKCVICGREFDANCACEDGHFVCNDCHSAGALSFLVPVLMKTEEKDPQKILESVMKDEKVHLHGPEHHVIVPCVLLTAYRNNGGELDLEKSLYEAIKRAKQVPGGACGYWGVCGAAAGTGIYVSILAGSTPMSGDAWTIPQKMVIKALENISSYGGPRCCKRTSRLAISAAVEFTGAIFGVSMPDSTPKCGYFNQNLQCIRDDCPYYPVSGKPVN